MKNLVTFFTVCFFATTLIGCSKGLSGTYKHDGSGRIIEFKSSTAFNIRYPDSTVVAGTYKKTKEGYEFSMAGGLVFAVVKKEGKSLRMDDALYLKQKEKSVFIFFVLIFSVLYWVLGIWFVVSHIMNYKWMGIKIYSEKNKQLSNTLIVIFMPIFGIMIILFIIYCIFTGQSPIDVT